MLINVSKCTHNVTGALSGPPLILFKFPKRPVFRPVFLGLLPRGGLEALRDPNVVIDLAGGGAGTRPFYNPDKNNFAPNFSFAWDPFKDGKTAVRGGYSLSFVIDSVIQMAENAAIDGNQGLTSSPTVNNLSGTVSGGGLRPIDTPTFRVPRTLNDQLTLSQFPTLFTIDPNLKTPYVQQWNFGIEHEILPWSTYNALQAEVRRRLRHGLYFQANYTYSKAYTDFEGSDANFSALLDLTLGGTVEKKRQTNDVTHIFKANGMWELPIGPGKRLFNLNGFVGHVLGGWQMNGIFEMRSGRPISFISGRGTLNRNARSGKNTATTSLSVEDLKNSMGIFFDPVTGRPLVIDPRLIGPDGRANPQFFGHPTPGTIGTLHLTPVSGPGFWNFDFSMIKRTRITERTNVEFRAEFFNVFNHTNFFTGENQTITSATFGQVTDTFDPRIIQFAVKFNF